MDDASPYATHRLKSGSDGRTVRTRICDRVSLTAVSKRKSKSYGYLRTLCPDWVGPVGL